MLAWHSPRVNWEHLEDLNVTFFRPKASKTQVYKSNLSKLNPLTSFCSTCNADFKISRSCINCLLSSSWACLIFKKQNKEERSRVRCSEVLESIGHRHINVTNASPTSPPPPAKTGDGSGDSILYTAQPGCQLPGGAACKHGIIQKQCLHQSICRIKTVSTLVWEGSRLLCEGLLKVSQWKAWGSQLLSVRPGKN